jgi:hypothetical protein
MMKRELFLAAAACSLVSAAPPRGPDRLSAAAREYLVLQLAIGQKEAGYIDAYYGPPTLEAEGKALASRAGLPALQRRAEALRERIARLGNGSSGISRRRARFLEAQLTAAITRLRMLRGEKLSFDDEAEGLFGVRPQLQPLSAFDPVLARIDRLVPGRGPLADRVDAFQNRFTIPASKLTPVFQAAIAECKARTLRHFPMPPREAFDLKLVNGKSWSGYNYYLGNYKSRIEMNTELPVRIDRAIDLGCHEGYPGHHALNSLLEQKLTRGRGWIEFSVYPLYSPQSFIAEGTANYGIELAFPGRDKVTFEAARLYPLAGLPTADAERFEQLRLALNELSGASMTIAKEFLEGRITEAQSIALRRKYSLVSEAKAKQLTAFAKGYRTYVINYGLGQDMARADVERFRSPRAKWRRFEEIISEPTLPSDLRSR